MEPRRIIEMCAALAEGHYRRGITPDMSLWRRSFDELASAIEQNGADPNGTTDQEGYDTVIKYGLNRQ